MPKVAFSNGCFDVLHHGHFNLLLYCRLLVGDSGKVVVGLDSDEKVKHDKGRGGPVFSFKERSVALYSLANNSDYFGSVTALVDEVHKFDSNEELYELIKTVKPDFIIKDSSWKGNVIGGDLCKVILMPKENSTTDIIERIEDHLHREMMK